MSDITEGLPVQRHADTDAANEEFTGIVTRLDTKRGESGWDPYEVWRTRVRAPAKSVKSAKGRKERSRDFSR